MLPTIDLCGLEVTRLIIGGNPFSGFSHQSRERDEEMLDYYTTERIKETLRRAAAAGINTTVMRSDPHIHRLLREYYNEGGTLQWIAQCGADSGARSVLQAVDRAVASGAKAAYIHGGQVDHCFAERDAETLTEWVDRIRSHGIPGGVAGHHPDAHRWVDGLDIADFHAVAFYNCGSLHDGQGEKFKPEDPSHAVAAIAEIPKPCIGYKIMAAGRVQAREALQFAFAHIKPTDAVNVGIYRGDNDDMIEEDVAIVEDVLARQRVA